MENQENTTKEEKVTMPEGYSSEAVTESFGSLTIQRPYATLHLPFLNIFAYFPAFFLLVEADALDGKPMKEQIFLMVKRFHNSEGVEVSKEDVQQAINADDYGLLIQGIAYASQQYKMTKEKKSTSNA